ncbi:DUF397 domain-containing protein [Streptomyces cyaneofuscatus]|nr:DUF397 domain-containing protein [Streptomyces cyaneofuscatus]
MTEERDGDHSENPTGPAITIGAPAWQAFVDGLRRGAAFTEQRRRYGGESPPYRRRCFQRSAAARLRRRLTNSPTRNAAHSAPITPPNTRV